VEHMSERTDRGPAHRNGPAPIQALARGLDILGQFTARDPVLSLAELGRRTGLNPATVYRYVNTLQAKGYLTQDPVTGQYRVGPAFAMSLFSLGGNSVLIQILEGDLGRLAEATGEGASLSVRRGDEVLNVNVIPPSSGFGQVIPANSAWPLTATWSAQVRVHLAYADEETRSRALAAPAVRYTENTVTDRGEVEALLEKTKREGIAYSLEERAKGRAAVAVPIFSHDALAAVLGLHIPPERFDEEHLKRYVLKLRAAAQAMGTRLEERSAFAAPQARTP
jgi:DNA-binding IclR family transcriptional regulator